MTLTELANKLKEIFEFDYLTVSKRDYKNTCEFSLWKVVGKKQLTYYKHYKFWSCDYPYKILNMLDVRVWADIDLSEYTDKDGNIDYSRCIVEVK